MRRGIVLVVAMLAAPCVHASSVELRYSWVYDEVKHRQHFGAYPSEGDIAARVAHAKELWEHEGEGVVGRIRKATSVDFPKTDLVVYLVGCGRGISDPITVALYARYGGMERGSERCEPQTDDWFLYDLTHELLHQVAESSDYAMLRMRLARAFPTESPITFNHILVAAFETRIHGFRRVEGAYSNPEYARALVLAKEFGLTTDEPLP